MSYAARRLRRARRVVASGGSGMSIGWLITGIGLGVLLAVTITASEAYPALYQDQLDVERYAD